MPDEACRCLTVSDIAITVSDIAKVSYDMCALVRSAEDCRGIVRMQGVNNATNEDGEFWWYQVAYSTTPRKLVLVLKMLILIWPCETSAVQE